MHGMENNFGSAILVRTNLYNLHGSNGSDFYKNNDSMKKKVMAFARGG